jgi:large subunit ribosomal protein L6
MSRIGKIPVKVPDKVKVKLTGRHISVEGPNGTLERSLPAGVAVTVEGDTIQVNPKSQSRDSRAQHGLARTLVQNMVTGVTQGFTKGLEILGVGYRAELNGNYIVFNLGYSHAIWYEVPPGLKAKLEQNKVFLTGASKEVLGAAAATIRSFRPPEPYKGKGIRYIGEVVRSKEGKSGGK